YSAERFFGHPEGVHLIPTWVSLVVVAGLLAISIIASVIASRCFDAPDADDQPTDTR
ncbi:MAG: hypothetical protein HQ581_14375, partial [Planctomycetes bacterium]|nr:hypothetical protein [Planctomycetota bacterium]